MKQIEQSPKKPSPFPSPLWGIILFVPVGFALVVSSIDLTTNENLLLPFVLLILGMMALIGGLGYFFHRRWARKAIMIFAIAGIISLFYFQYVWRDPRPKNEFKIPEWDEKAREQFRNNTNR